uniref:Uncharacterized protein n=1 Tax=Aegilops tauschii subsp. strangulata TaxID=200361 RepID=A0A452Y0A9_AEGTS
DSHNSSLFNPFLLTFCGLHETDEQGTQDIRRFVGRLDDRGITE